MELEAPIPAALDSSSEITIARVRNGWTVSKPCQPGMDTLINMVAETPETLLAIVEDWACRQHGPKPKPERRPEED